MNIYMHLLKIYSKLFREAPGGPASYSLLPAAPPHQGRLQGGGGQAHSGGGGAGQAGAASLYSPSSCTYDLFSLSHSS